MNEDDLAKIFSGSDMASFSQFSERGIIEGKMPVSNREIFASEDSGQIPTANDSVQGGGGLDFIVRKDPSQLNETTDHRLGFALRSVEWSSLFFDVLGCPLAEPFVQGDDIHRWTENRKTRFEGAIPQYPLLARMWDPFQHVWYSPDEIIALKHECEMAAQLDSNTRSSKQGLRKLETACDEALSAGLGLYLLSD